MNTNHEITVMPKSLWNEDDLVELEDEILEHSAEMLNGFLQLPPGHPSNSAEFLDGLHKCQNIILAGRAARWLPLGHDPRRKFKR